jgi:molybdate transport system substrate-binding protein
MPKRLKMAWILCFAALCFASCTRTDPNQAAERCAQPSTPLVVFAAASLRDVLSDVARSFKLACGGSLEFNFAGSNVLAQQIAAAPGADLFVAANRDWIDTLEKSGQLVPNTTGVITANSLVLIAHRASSMQLARIEDLAALPFRYLAVGDPNSVPAGKYAREYLSSVRNASGQDVWFGVKARIAPAPDVRAALSMVESNVDVLGVVYRTDAMASARAKVLLEVPVKAAGGSVRYYAALVKSSKQIDRARKLLAFLSEEEAQATFTQHGFLQVAR